MSSRMLSRAWAFACRNKWKLIFGTTAGAAAAAAAAAGLRIYREYRRIASLLEEPGELENLLLQQLGVTPDALDQLQLQQQQQHITEEEWRAVVHFLRNQAVSDRTVLKILPQVRQTLTEQFSIDEYTQLLRDPTAAGQLTPRQKEEVFKDMAAHVIARTLAAVYILVLLQLLHRLEINLIAAQFFDDELVLGTQPQLQPFQKQQHSRPLPDQQELHLQENFVFLTSTRHASAAETIACVASACLQCTRRALADIPPQRQLTVLQLQQLCLHVLQAADALLRNGGNEVSLPSTNVKLNSVDGDPSRIESKRDVQSRANEYAATGVTCSATRPNEARGRKQETRFLEAADVAPTNGGRDPYTGVEIGTQRSRVGCGYLQLLLPGEQMGVDKEQLAALPAASAARVQQLLAETKDFVDSPAFETALWCAYTSATEKIMDRLIEGLQANGVLPTSLPSDKLMKKEQKERQNKAAAVAASSASAAVQVSSAGPGAGDAAEASTAAAAEETTTVDPIYEQPFALARCLGRVCFLAEWVLRGEDMNDVMTFSGMLPQVQEFGALAFFPPDVDLGRIHALLRLINQSQQHQQSGHSQQWQLQQPPQQRVKQNCAESVERTQKHEAQEMYVQRRQNLLAPQQEMQLRKRQDDTKEDEERRKHYQLCYVQSANNSTLNSPCGAIRASSAPDAPPAAPVRTADATQSTCTKSQAKQDVLKAGGALVEGPIDFAAGAPGTSTPQATDRGCSASVASGCPASATSPRSTVVERTSRGENSTATRLRSMRRDTAQGLHTPDKCNLIFGRLEDTGTATSTRAIGDLAAVDLRGTDAESDLEVRGVLDAAWNSEDE